MTEANLTQVFDAKVWAQEFCKINQNLDEGIMIGWFANAIMAGYDRAKQENAAIRKECADRAMHWLEELHGVEPDPALPWSKKLMRIRELQRTTLRAAIMGEQIKP